MRNKVKATEDNLMWESFISEAGDDAIRLKMAVAEVAGALGSGRISLKSYDRDAGTLVVSTGGDKSIILKAVGFEGDHDIPISLRPDKHPEDEPGMGPEYRVRSDEPEPFGYGRD